MKVRMQQLTECFLRKVMIMEEKLSEINIPKVDCDINDKKMLIRIKKFKAGTIRILTFTIVGMVIGWFGYTYTADSFIFTKIIFAIPYKISEAIYTKIIGTSHMTSVKSLFGFETDFFRQSALATFLAEHITPVVIGGAIYGCLAYFTGDKKVFTMQRFVKFISVCMGVLLLYIGCVYGINYKAEYDNNHLYRIDYFYLTAPDRVEAILDKETADKLLKSFENGLCTDNAITRDEENEISIKIVFSHGMRSMVTMVNCDENYLVTQNGSIYHVSKEFTRYVKNYYETGSLMGIQNIIIS